MGGSDGISQATGLTCGSPAARGTSGSSSLVGGTARRHGTILRTIVALECGRPKLPPEYVVRNEEQEKKEKKKDIKEKK